MFQGFWNWSQNCSSSKDKKTGGLQSLGLHTTEAEKLMASKNFDKKILLYISWVLNPNLKEFFWYLSHEKSFVTERGHMLEAGLRETTITRVYVFWVWQNYFEVGCYCYADLSCPKNLYAVWDTIDWFFMPKQMVNGFSWYKSHIKIKYFI